MILGIDPGAHITPNGHTMRACKTCGIVFASKNQSTPRMYCSSVCRPRYNIASITEKMRQAGLAKRASDGWLSGSRNPNYRGGPSIAKCMDCEKEFAFHFHEGKRGMFCSRNCCESYIKTHPKGARTANEIRIGSNISRGIRNSLKSSKNGAHWEDIVGYTVGKLIAHLEQQFLPNMSWENYGVNGWHIDHKIPQSHFNFSSVNDRAFLECWAIENLQPLWSIDNWKKNNLKNKNRVKYE